MGAPRTFARCSLQARGSRGSGACRWQSWMAPRRRIAFERPCLRWTTSSQNVLMACLVPEQSRRPGREEVQEALALFCSQYADNVARSLRGGPGTVPFGRGGGNGSPASSTLRRAARVAADALSAAVAVGGAVTAGLLTQDMTVAFPAGQPAMVGADAGTCGLRGLAGALIARQNIGFGFARRGVLGSLLGSAVAGLLASLTAWPSEVGLGRSLCGAVFSPSSLLYRDWSPIGPWRCLRCRLRPPPPR